MGETVSDFIVRRMAHWGVRRVFGYPGDGINGLMGAFGRGDHEIEFLQTRHEELAAFMACAHAKFTNEVGVCVATSGPGAIHLLNGLYDAMMDHQPVVAIVGQQDRAALGGSYQQEVDLNSLYKDVAREYVETCMAPTQARHLIDRAFRIALAERCVTCIILPKDVQEMEYEEPPRKHGSVHSSAGYRPPKLVPRDQDIRAAAAALNSGERVAMLVGAGALQASDEVAHVAELLGAGVAKALLGRTVLPDTLSYVTGAIGLLGTKPSWDLMNGCDTLLMVGTSFPYSEFLPKEGAARGIQIDHDGRQLGIRYPTEVNLIGDSRETLKQLIPLLEKKKDRRWREELESEIADWWRLMDLRAHTKANPVNPQLVYFELSPRLPDGAIITADSGSSANWWARDLKMRDGMKASLSGNLATMACGMPYAVAAKLAHPDRPVIACVGDGATQMLGINSLIDAMKYKEKWRDPRFIVLVLNNGDLNQVTWEMRVMSGDPKFKASQELPEFPYAKYAELIGFKGIRVDRPEDVGPAWDSAVAPDKVGHYLRELKVLFERYGYDASLYGHFGMGCIHCRIPFDLASEAGIAKYRSFVEDASDLVHRLGGSFSGEHGSGQARGELLVKMFGSDLVQAFREYKHIWDPDWKMNPGKLVDARPLDADLRIGADYAPKPVRTHFKYPDDKSSFAHATLRCVGIGKCRRLDASGENQTMCPSFMVTREEKHTTRGRAHLLWEMVTRGPIDRGWADEAVKESLDLCLSCKGCKGDCPVNVDIATHKAEFLSHYYEVKRRPRQAYAFGFVDQWSRLASLVPGLANLATQTPGLRAIAKMAANVPQERQLPPFAPETFEHWFRARGSKRKGAPKVVLFADTFNNHFFPRTAKAAVQVLEHAGYEVVVPDGHLCCGRPLYDYGFLDQAKRYAERVMTALRPHLEAGRQVVVLEPSCASVFRDEVQNLWPDRKEAKELGKQTRLLAEFLREVDYEPPHLDRQAIIQGHCHQKSVLGMKDEEQLLKQMGLEARQLDSGCCGMAGAFGYERGDKYDVSIACGERVLLPEVRNAKTSTLIVADGFSCREQIAQETGRHGLHVAEVIEMALHSGRRGPPGDHPPERQLATQHRREVRRSMVKAILSLVGAAVALAILSKGMRR